LLKIQHCSKNIFLKNVRTKNLGKKECLHINYKLIFKIKFDQVVIL